MQLGLAWVCLEPAISISMSSSLYIDAHRLYSHINMCIHIYIYILIIEQ